MKTIGILTTYFASNFGAALQPFALKRTLENLGFEVELLRYKQHKVYHVYKPYHIRRVLTRHVRSAVRYILSLPILAAKEKNFSRFVKKYVQNKSGFEKKIPEKDFYVMGSDQIWNPAVTGGFDDVYFGNFPVKKGVKKIAYAASAENISYSQNEIDYIKKNIWNFDCVAVRERPLAENLKKVSGRMDIECVLDPTLLANPTIYEEISVEHPLRNKRFVFFYKIRDSWEFVEKIHAYAQSIGACLLILSSWYERTIEKYAHGKDDVYYFPAAGVETFLGAIRFAECVFSPSFHGCAFSIIYHKAFFGLMLKDKWNSRVEDLLNSLELKTRLLRVEDEISNKAIDFVKMETLLDLRRTKSQMYLKKALDLVLERC